MQIIETISPVEETQRIDSASRVEGWKPSTVAADIATLGSGTALAALINVVLVFLIPRLISVKDYGYWRLFGLYAGYVGFFHFGFADGALLRWSGRPFAEIQRQILPSLKILFWLQVICLVPLCIAFGFLPGELRFASIAVALYALVCNPITLLQFALQGARVFRPVAISTVLAPGLFLGFVLFFALNWPTHFSDVIILYLLALSIVLGLLLFQTQPWQGRMLTPMRALAKDCFLTGWPIVMANTGVMLISYADRLAVSWTGSIQNFAQYSLAASAMAVPITAIQACSKVFFSHLAAITPEARRRIYGISSRTLLITWAILLPYYFALDIFIRHILPRYLQSLVYARILLLGIPFMAAIQILQMNYTYLNGMQKRFLARTVAVLAVSIGLTSFAAFHGGSLGIVAGVQVAILGGWWLFNEWALRDLKCEKFSYSIKFLGIYSLASVSYWISTGWQRHELISTLFYYSCLVILLSAACREELRAWTGVMGDTKAIRAILDLV